MFLGKTDPCKMEQLLSAFIPSEGFSPFPKVLSVLFVGYEVGINSV